MSTLEDWTRRAIDRYNPDDHDALCEQHERATFCHCPKRKREAAGLTGPVSLTFPPPYCDRCLDDLRYEDGWRCPTCQAMWPERAMEGDKTEEYADDHGDLSGHVHMGRRIAALAAEARKGADQ